ncbi:Ldh family oxidoreductase [Mycobacterium lacus]|nr:Ldh family oxidoreductase [Mycobacterium lacus]
MVSADSLQALIVDVLTAYGAREVDAHVQAQNLVEADLRDQHSHGLRRLEVLVGRIRYGVLLPRAQPRQEWKTAAVLRVDGNRGFGPVVAFSAVQAILDRAATTGVALASISNANHLGMLAPYVEKMAEAGMVGIALTTSEALVHAWCGATAMVGTNPIAIAAPTGPDSEPLVLDMSTSSVSMGKILSYAQRGEPIPLGWAVGPLGQPTTNASLAARAGAISPFGGAKGYALGITVEAVVAALTGTALGRDIRGTLDETSPCNKGDLLICISPHVLGLSHLLPQIADYLEQVRASGVSGDPVRVPGDRARTCRQHRLKYGIPLHQSAWTAALAMRDQARSHRDGHCC